MGTTTDGVPATAGRATSARPTPKVAATTDDPELFRRTRGPSCELVVPTSPRSVIVELVGITASRQPNSKSCADPYVEGRTQQTLVQASVAGLPYRYRREVKVT